MLCASEFELAEGNSQHWLRNEKLSCPMLYSTHPIPNYPKKKHKLNGGDGKNATEFDNELAFGIK